MPTSPTNDPLPAPLVFRSRPQLRHLVLAALGSVVIGVLLPCALISLRCLGKPALHTGGSFEIEFNYDPIGMFSAAMILCGPGAMFLAVVVFRMIEYSGKNRTQAQTIRTGACYGTMMAFLNIPGYFASEFLRGDSWVIPRIALLFAVAGASCGMWIAWMAWRSFYPGERLLPRFSLRTLLLLVVLWGVVMLCFQPRQWPNTPVLFQGNW